MNFNKKKGVLLFTIPGVDFKNDVLIKYVNFNRYFLDVESKSSNSVYLNRNPEIPVNYFVRNNITESNGALGLQLSTIQGDVKFKIRKKYLTIWGWRFFPITNTEYTFPYDSLQTNWLTLNLTPAEKNIINSNSFIAGIAISSIISSQSTFYIDNSIDTISFLLSGIPNDTAFINNNFTLTDPNNTIIDSVYANQHSNIIFKQNVEDAMAYYYIINPMPGNWSAQYNPNIVNPLLIAPVQSPVTVDVVFEDSVYVAGDTIKFLALFPKGININIIQIASQISFVRRGTDTVTNIGNLVLKKISDSSYSGQFPAEFTGEYNIETDLDCIYNSQNIQRKNYSSISLSTFRAPNTVFPKDDSLSVSQNVKFVWNSNGESKRYSLEIYEIGDTVPAFTNLNIRDTSLLVNGLLKETKYFWRIRSYNPYDTSIWSQSKIFTTIINPPDNTELESPPDNSGGLFTPLSLHWKRSEKAEKYHCQVSTDSLFGNLVYNDSAIVDTTTIVNILSFPEHYYWRVRAENIGGYSDYTVPWSFNTIEPITNSYMNIKIVPQGLYNNIANNLQRSDTLKGYLVSNNSPYNIIDSAITIIDSVTLEASFQFPNAPTGIYYLKIKHRNSIETWSKAGGEAFTRFGTTFYDFTSDQNKAFGNNQIFIDPVWCLYSGDANQDGIIDASDLSDVENAASISLSGYVNTDLTGDDFVDGSDVSLVENNSSNSIIVIQP